MVEYYESQQTGLGIWFINSVESALSHIEETRLRTLAKQFGCQPTTDGQLALFSRVLRTAV